MNPIEFEKFQNLHFPGNLTQSIDLDSASSQYGKEIEFCAAYESETIYKILSKISNYGLKLFCGFRTFKDYITQYVIFFLNFKQNFSDFFFFFEQILAEKL